MAGRVAPRAALEIIPQTFATVRRARSDAPCQFIYEGLYGAAGVIIR
jgi:hypothetical protein